MHVLVVDDQSFWRRALEESLLERGHRVTCAESGEKAWATLQTAPDIDVVLTDWVMGGMSGPELCQRIRGADAHRYVPIILMTSRGKPDDLATALESGADAFLPKPFDEPELVAQLRMTERILALESRLERRITELRLAKERIERDLAQAAVIQRSFMPSEPPAIPGVQFAWSYETCVHLGGDIFGVIPLSETCVGLHVLDVSGHGTSAALHSVALSHVLHAHPQQGGILTRPNRRASDRRGASYEISPPAEVAAELNRRFPLMERSGHYVTFLYGVLDLATRRFRYTRAGHPGPIVADPGSVRCVEDGGGVPIGVSPDATWDEGVIELAPGATLLLFTDGALEMLDEEGAEFGLDRIVDAVRRRADRDIEAVVSGLRTELEEFRKGEPSRDDVTLLGLQLES